MKQLSYILSVIFLFGVVFNTNFTKNTTLKRKDKTERQEKLQIATSQQTVLLGDIKLSPLLSLDYSIRFCVVKNTCSEFISQFFVDKYLKVLLLFFISPHAP